MRDDDPMLESDAMVTETRIKVLRPLRKVLLGTRDGIWRISGDVAPDAPWAWRKDQFVEDSERAVRCLAQDPGTGATLAGFAGGGDTLELSDDGGRTWSTAPGWPVGRSVWSLATPGAGRVVAGTGPAGLLHGELPGEDWTENASVEGLAKRDGARIRALAQSSVDPSRWLAAVDGGLWLSVDGGESFEVVAEGFDASAVAFTRGGAAAAATSQGIMRSPDGGATWVGPVGPQGKAVGICVDVAGTLFATMGGEASRVLFSSQDKGGTWQPYGPDDQPLPEPIDGVHALAADSLHPGVVYFGGEDRVVLVSAEATRTVAEDLDGVRCMLVV
jgi:hypothetical protein